MVPRQRLSGAVHSWRGGSFRRGKNLPCFTAILVSSLLQLRKRRSESTYGATRFSLTALPTDILIHQGAPNTRRFRSFSRIMAIFTNGINGRERVSFLSSSLPLFSPVFFSEKCRVTVSRRVAAILPRRFAQASSAARLFFRGFSRVYEILGFPGF